MVKEMDQYIISEIPYLVDKYDENTRICNELYTNLETNYGYRADKERAMKLIDNAINQYKNDHNNIETIAKGLTSDLKNLEVSVVQGTTYNRSVSKGSKKTINVESDKIEKTISDYKTIQEEKDNTEIKSTGYVKEVFNEYQAVLTKEEEEIDEIIQEIGVETIATLEQIDVIDDRSAKIISDDDVRFSDLVSIYSMYKSTGSKIKIADASDFTKAGYTVTDGVVKITGSDGIRYEYNVNTNMLVDSNGNSLEVRYYLPSSYSDLSSLNTITCLSGQREESMYKMSGQNDFFLQDISSDAILVIPNKKLKNGVNMDLASFSYMSDEVITGTKFANAFAKTKGKNIIVGCSNGGGSALKIASKSDGLYSDVISINYAAVFEGEGKGKNPGDNNQLSIEEARNLDGKNLVFISSSGDPNVDGGSNSYVYKGLTKIIDCCPNADITFLTNNSNSAFSNINASNYHYYGQSSDYWKNNLGNYSGHGDYHKAFRDVLNSDIFSM